MGLTFKDYVVIADALETEQLEEGWMDSAILAIKKKLGGKMSDDEIKGEIEKLKSKKGGAEKKVAGGAERVAQTQQSRDFHARRAEMAAKTASRQPQGTVGTGPNTAASLNSKPMSAMRGGELRAIDRNPFGEGLNEAKLFIVTFTAKAGGPERRARLAAKDVTDVRRKFMDSYFGKKIVSVEPAKLPVKKATKVEEDCGPLGPRS